MKDLEKQAFEGVAHKRRDLMIMLGLIIGAFLGVSIFTVSVATIIMSAISGNIIIIPLLIPLVSVGALGASTAIQILLNSEINESSLNEFLKVLHSNAPDIKRLFKPGTLSDNEISCLNGLLIQQPVKQATLSAYGKKSGLKELLFVMICLLPIAEQKALLEAALKPGTDLNIFFATKRGWFKTSPTSGMLGKIAEQLQAVKLIMSPQESEETPSDYQRIFQKLTELETASKLQGQVIIELGNMVVDLTERLEDKPQSDLDHVFPNVPTGNLIDFSIFPSVPTTTVPSKKSPMYPSLN